MDRYQRVEKPKEESPINENEIRVTAQGRMRNYITYATNLLQEKGATEIALKAMGRAINKTVMIAELIRRRIGGLHQNTSIGSTDITDTWEPLEEGLLPLETTRHVSVITITLSKNELDTSSAGYQPPIPEDQVKTVNGQDYQGDHQSTMGRIQGGRGRGRGRRTGRGRGRGGRGRGRASYFHGGAEHVVDGAQDGGPGYLGRGRGRGRGYRGRGGQGYTGQGRGYSLSPNNSNGGGPLGPNQGRGRGRGWGMVRGRGRGRGVRSDGPSQEIARDNNL